MRNVWRSVCQPIQRPSPIRSAGLPLRVGLLMDWSDSVQDRRGFEQEAAAEFVHGVLQPRRDEAFVIGIGTRPQLMQPLTGDPERIRAAPLAQRRSDLHL